MSQPRGQQFYTTVVCGLLTHTCAVKVNNIIVQRLNNDAISEEKDQVCLMLVVLEHEGCF